MYYNLRPPDVASVVLGFNYEAHNPQTINSIFLQPSLDSTTVFSQLLIFWRSVGI